MCRKHKCRGRTTPGMEEVERRREQPSRMRTTAWMQEVEQRREQLPRSGHPRVTFDSGHPWPSPCGRAQARPISLPAKLCYGESHHKFVGSEFEQLCCREAARPRDGPSKAILPRKASPASQVPSPLVGLRRCAYGPPAPVAKFFQRRRHCAQDNVAHPGGLRPLPKERSPRALGAISLSRMRTREVHRAPRWARLRPFLGVRLAYRAEA